MGDEERGESSTSITSLSSLTSISSHHRLSATILLTVSNVRSTSWGEL